MSPKSDVELADTKAKLARLEAPYAEVREDTSEDSHVRELTLYSLKRHINQFKEEIACYEAHQRTRR
jgi:hypothetical protein